MACADQISTTDLENAKLNATTLGEVATSRAGATAEGALIDESTNRFGESTDTVQGRLKKMGYAVPVVYDASIDFTVNDNVKTVDQSGIVYAPLPSALPFTTSGVWVGDDDQRFFVIQSSGDAITVSDMSIPYVFDTIALFKESLIAFPVGKSVYIKENLATYTIIQGTETANTYDIIASDSVYQSISYTLPFNATLNPRTLGATDGIGVDDADSIVMRTANSALLNFAFDKYKYAGIKTDIIIRTYGSITVYDGQTVQGVNRSTCGIIGYHPTEATFIDETLDTTEGLNTNDMLFEDLSLQSLLSDKVFHITPYKCMFRNNSFRCPFGAAFDIHDGGYQVENTWQSNNFNACLTGIVALGGVYDPTDNFILNNYFYADNVSDYHVRMSNASGTLLQGNHYYGGCNYEFVRLSAVLNTRFVGEYFEGNIHNTLNIQNARVSIIGGNPNSVTFSGCDFWKGDGGEVDHEGDKSCLIKASFSLYNPFSLSMTSCNFDGGSGSVPIFGFTNGTPADSSQYYMSFNSSNIVRGTYDLFEKFTGSSLAGNVVQTDHPYFNSVVDTQNGDYINPRGEIYSVDTGSATSFPALPANLAWLNNKPVIINNVSTTTSLQFSVGSSYTIGGINPVPPETRVKIIQDPTGINDILIAKA